MVGKREMVWQKFAWKNGYHLLLASLSLFSVFNSLLTSHRLFSVVDVNDVALVHSNDDPAKKVATEKQGYTPTRRRKYEKYCCNLVYHDNIGHAMTETVLDLHRCGPVVAPGVVPRAKDPRTPIDKQILQVAKLLNKTVVSKNLCHTYYFDMNPTAHPDGGRLHAYSRMNVGYRTWYDAIPNSNSLRDIQNTILKSCDLEPIKFKDDPYDEHRDPYDRNLERRPSRSVMIVKRDPMRKLLNTEELLTMCKHLNLDCRIFEANRFFQETPDDTDYLCHALKEFNKDDPLVIGNQGAEMTYALLSGLRMFLMAFSEDFEPNPGCRIGNHTLEGEEQVATNLICKGYGKGVDVFFSEFASMYGAKINAIHSTADQTTFDKWKSEKQCKGAPYYCTDRTADIEDVRKKLEHLISDGKLVTLDRISAT